ncbi:MAG: carboxypeptidase-like regulatory domain-containing protein, partial [Bacteroides sp]|nr:carboxypeptidase-like regulatory domain-containing protein [Bacteroides sp.]
MKRFYLFLLGIMALIVTTQAQNLTGKVLDEKNMPLAYANVVLQTADSVYLAGTTTDIEGKFTLAKHENAKLINISFVGYTTVVEELTSNQLGNIQLYPDAQLLGEVVVKGYLPKTQAKGDAMVTQVSGTLLEKAGTAENLLNKIPNVTSQDGSVMVFGRGTPEIYINGRKMRNPQELDRLSSDDLKSVEVVSNPGARYDASVKAVIRLITKKKAGEGFGLNNRAVVRSWEKYGWTTFDQLDMNYRKNGLDVSTMLYAGNLMNGSAQTFVIDTHLD